MTAAFTESTVAGREDAPPQQPELQVVLEGVFERRRFLDLLRHFIVFEDSAAAGGGGGKLVKKMAGYHQFHAVNAAVERKNAGFPRRMERKQAVDCTGAASKVVLQRSIPRLSRQVRRAHSA
jgi:type I site-specific restriction-modification system R (restriction) subunit